MASHQEEHQENQDPLRSAGIIRPLSSAQSVALVCGYCSPVEHYPGKQENHTAHLSSPHCPTARHAHPSSSATEPHLPFSPPHPRHSYSLFSSELSVPKFTFAHRRFGGNGHQDLKPTSFWMSGILFPHYADQGSAEIWPQFTPSPCLGFNFHRKV